MTLEKATEKPIKKEKEQTTKEKEKVNHTRQMAVNHSLPPQQDRGRSPLKVSINNNMKMGIGPKTVGGLIVMPPRTNNTGAKTTGPTVMAGLPSPTTNVSCPGWNPGTPLTCAKILSM